MAPRLQKGTDVDLSPQTAPAPSVSLKVDSPAGPAALSAESTVDAGIDDPRAAGSLSVADHADDDVSMDPPQPPAEGVASPPRTSRLPTLADVLGQQEHLRRDHANDDAGRRCVETPTPLSSDIEWIERQYAAGGDWSFIYSRIDQARTYALPRARYDMLIATGRTLAKTPLQKRMRSLSGKHHGNASLENLYHNHEIGQISKLPGGNLHVRVK